MIKPEVKMAKAKSLVRFIRQQLKFPGSTVHSGRGFWMCDVDTTWAEFSDRVRVVAATLKEKGVVTEIDDRGHEIIVTFKVKVNPSLANLDSQTTTQVPFREGWIVRGMYTVAALYDIDA